MSLVTTPASQLSTCRLCGSPRTTSIAMTLTDGSDVTMVSCRQCERRTWVQDGAELPVDSVLVKARKHR